ncbi:MAG: hypothetical protein FWH44_04580 [Methanomassiliicoccaceae archaeon]|nr:hypothetical protein [Methanomassiliicoccaceae archaeon]MCL2143514.1 hypothetical protein [Methanomassiliicoccaceae archaeon]
MRPNVYLALSILCGIGIFAAFGVFAYNMTTSDPFGDDSSAFGIVLSVLLYLVTAGVMMFLMAFFFIRYSRTKGQRSSGVPTKICVSCGAEIDAMEMSCPRCFTLQPADGRGKR